MGSRTAVTTLAASCVAVFLLILLILATTTQDVRAAGVVGNGTPASCTQAALVAEVSGGGNVTFNCGPAEHFIILSSPIYITSQTEIDGGDKIVLSGNNATRIFIVASMGNLKLRNIVLANGYSAQDGGAINMTGPATLENVIIRNSRSDLSGGAIASVGAPITATETIFAENRAATGGALYARFGTATVRLYNSSFRDNQAAAGSGVGGAILPWDGAVVYMQGGEATGNQAYQGGFVALLHSTSGFHATGNGRFESNLASHGAVLYLSLGAATIQNGALTLNSALSGGAIYAAGGTVEVTRTTFLSNSASIGGAIVVAGVDATPSLHANESVFRDNFAGLTGGALSLGVGSAILMNSTFDHNHAPNFGGAIYVYEDAFLDLENITLAHNYLTNTAPESAGGALFLQGQASVRNSTFADNTASEGGSLFLEVDSYGEFDNVVFAQSAGSNCGGVSFAPDTTFNLSSDMSCALTGATNTNGTDPKLGPLQNNGGFVDTMLPLPGSPLIDGGDCASASTSDARGVTRPQLGACDIGAVEVPPAPLATATPTATSTPTLTPTHTPSATPTGTLTQTSTPTPSTTPGTPVGDHVNFQPMINR